MDPQPLDNKPPAPADDSPWWLKHTVKFVATAGPIIAIGLGAFACVTIYPSCLLAGIMQMCIGLFVVVVESPCLCPFLDFAQAPGKFFDQKPLWMRAIIYVVLAILPIITCPGFSTIFGSGLIFVAGSLYGVLALGKKADLSVMRTRAASTSNLIGGGANQNSQANQFVANQANQFVANQVQAGTQQFMNNPGQFVNSANQYVGGGGGGGYGGSEAPPAYNDIEGGYRKS